MCKESSMKQLIEKSKAVSPPPTTTTTRPRRGKRDKNFIPQLPPAQQNKKTKVTKQSRALQRHGKKDGASGGGVEAMLPSLIGVAVLVVAVMAQHGFRGRASVAGIDLGTTNSVICVQAPSKSIGTIDCIPDPLSGSPIIPSVVSFLEPHERKVGPSSKIPSLLVPHPSHVVVGHRAKQRIESHPQHTLFHAKRVLGRPMDDPAVAALKHEVEFDIIAHQHPHDDDDDDDEVAFRVDDMIISPRQVGSYVVHHLIQITKQFMGHDNIQSAVLAVPAKFNALQRQRTMEAFKAAGVNIVRVLEEPAAAALAYGLHKKEGVEKILVYDFGGGTLDVSILHVAEGYCEVMGSDGDDRLGGADFDAAVAAILTQQHSSALESLSQYPISAEELSALCPNVSEAMPICSVSSLHTLGEQLKIRLSETGTQVHATCLAVPPASEENTALSHPVPTAICDRLIPTDLSLSMEQFNEAAKPLFERSILPVTRLLKDLTLNEDEMDEIVMVGGTTRMPQIRSLVREAFSTAQMNTHIDPDLTVAYGAASVND